MDKLELRHLAPYLPYGLKGYATDINLTANITLQTVEFVISEQPRALPILRPMSDLDNPKKYNRGGGYYSYLSEMNFGLSRHVDRDLDFEIKHNHWIDITYINCEDALNVYDFLFEHHFDVFGLIDKGLAIDVNTLEQEVQNG